MKERLYLCIDLKSFYASVECVERGLDPMTAHLIVADPERENGTICLAVSPALRAKGVRNRCRVFEIPPHLPYVMATPQMQLYIRYSADIYSIYLKYIAKEDIHVYSIDEAFLDVTDYLGLYRMTARELARRIMDDIQASLGIPSACGAGANLYLAKVALDICAKRMPDRIASLDEGSYRQTLWDHRPITDFWRVGPGIAGRLAPYGIHTMGQVARTDEALLYRLFGVDAEYLIDHAWGREPVTIADIHAYRPQNSSLSNAQVLMRDYSYEEGLLILKEMADLLCLELAERCLVTNSLSLYVGYSGRRLPSLHKTVSMTVTTDSVRVITEYLVRLYERHVDRSVPVRRISLSFNNVADLTYEQYDLFTDPNRIERDRKLQRAVLDIKKKYGKNAILRGMDLQKAATTRERNRQIGGHRSGES